MKTTKKITWLVMLTCITIITVYSCKKEKNENPSSSGTTETFSSLDNFFALHGVQNQTYTMNAVTGGSFTSPQGTTVSIPANAFVDALGTAVAGTVTITFKDIYKKSDMLLARATTQTAIGKPLKSGGEFFVDVQQGGSSLLLAAGKTINVAAPVSATGTMDSAMTAYRAIDSSGTVASWTLADTTSGSTDYVAPTPTEYQYACQTLNGVGGTWTNCDHSISATSCSLTFHQLGTSTVSGVDIFFLFSSLNTNVILYSDTNWNYAPTGYQGTMVALGVKDGKLYSSFLPVTVLGAATVNFTMSETTSAAFETQLNALN